MRLLFILTALVCARGFAQEYGKPDRDQPGDEMIQQYLRDEATRFEADFLRGVKTAEEWQRARTSLRQEYLEMLGLWPVPERTPLQPAITRTIDRGDYLVDCLHYQSRPGLYVTANLYRPARIEPGERLPAVLYVCGHSGRGRNGNKTAFQSHGIWLARHGYVCLIVDTLQWSEIPGIHHGTYREQRWWWLSRGYTPAGVECWNGIRGLDYLVSRPDVDPARLGVTGISGGGAATFWIAAADERVKAAVPVSGMADLVSYVSNRVINGHCDCMFLYNTYQWPWARIAALIAPRPMLFMNSDEDPIFPMDANERVISRLERLYSLFEAGDRVDAFVSVGGHDYRRDIRQAAFRFLNTHLKNDPRPVTDTEIDLVTDGRNPVHPIPPEQLRAFPTDADLPRDAINGRIDEEFVPISARADASVAALRRMTFHHFPEKIPAAVPEPASGQDRMLRTEANISVRLNRISPEITAKPARILLMAGEGRFEQAVQPSDLVFRLELRGTGATRWTSKNPPNYVERSHYLLGRTTDSGRIWDLIAAARFLQSEHPGLPVVVAGEKGRGALAVYAALLEPEIASVMVRDLPASLMSPEAPVLLNALRVCDLPGALRLLGPGRLERLP